MMHSFPGLSISPRIYQCDWACGFIYEPKWFFEATLYHKMEGWDFPFKMEILRFGPFESEAEAVAAQNEYLQVTKRSIEIVLRDFVQQAQSTRSDTFETRPGYRGG